MLVGIKNNGRGRPYRREYGPPFQCKDFVV